MAAGMAVPKEQKPQTTDLLDMTILRGFVLFKRVTNSGQNLQFFALRIHYTTIGPVSGVKTGVILMRPMAIPNALRGMYSRFYIFIMFHGGVTP